MASPNIGHLIHPPDPPLLPPAPTGPPSTNTVPPLGTSHHHPPPSRLSLAPLVVPSAPVYRPSPSPAAPLPDLGQTQTPPRNHSNVQSLYQCADCLRRYSRPEHLQRHIATHTLGKRFACDVCSKAFSRADLLKRHRTNHQDDNGTKRKRINSSPGAGRVAHACQACAKARVKCEELKPCTRCRNRGLSCEYASSEDAALHLLHLSANARGVDYPQESSPESPYYPHSSVVANSQRQQQQAAQDQIRPAYPPPVNTQTVDHSPVFTGNPSLKEETQLPTPETMVTDGFQPPYPGSAVDDMAKAPFGDFLRDVLYDQSLDHPTRLAEAQGLAVLDFCDDTSLDLREFDFGLLHHWNVDGSPSVPDLRSGPDNFVDMTAMRSRLVKMWTESPWRWTPAKTDNGYNEQSNLPLPSKDAHTTAQMQADGRLADRVIEDRLHTSGRDKILAIVLGTCRNDAMMARVASSFPSVDIMDSWINIFLASHLCSVSSWIHYGSFSLNTQWPEWLAIAASAGAVLAPVPTLRRFGFALQEAVRLTIPSRFEENNKTIADPGLVQALMLIQDVGLWSGNRRKMEIAECQMMRYRGKFQRSAYPSIVIHPSDEGKVLEEKWKQWYQSESWKRLAFHAYLRDSQVSMTQFCNPHISYAELTLPLPCSKELWFARSAEEFKVHYLGTAAAGGKQPPSLGDLFRDINLLSITSQLMDVQFAVSVYLHGFWSMIWEYRQLNSVYRPTAQSPAFANSTSLLLETRHQELCKQLQGFQFVTLNQSDMMSAQESLMLHLLLMNLHVSLDDLQLFSGKEGEEQARRVYPTLQRWSTSVDARQAIWHAGQILRHGKRFPLGHLKDFYAIGVHHASLCLWTHGVIERASRPPGHQQHGHLGYNGTVYIDGDDCPIVHRYISFGQGRASIRGPTNTSSAVVDDPRGYMEVTQEILRANFIGGPDSLPPISENIIHLLKQLSNAAWAVGLA
ncbi:hypothetical protein B0T26DRAFT_760975 [Lasiosphaeria miniovina]|uniref:Uncharacterized protein n=1 Tax=Lasiosphaeria miniovina TaxID=1954250 RepID=A0AA40BH47_9PEZI|nr:uncharacterized protein B0T26DRAFT_760975 [Lasiosphaeria miniovina]KAK0734128.1 hypothetical protein B0T26DRAFT_760975 [Lasiosphaeria miniovina]